MRRIILFALLGLGSLVSAQNNEKLKKQLAKKKQENAILFEIYAKKRLTQETPIEKEENIQDTSIYQQLQDERRKVATFIEGIPFFYENFDTDQINNSNADVLQNGSLKGLENSKILGEGIHIGVFDGGRAYAPHADFLKNSKDLSSSRVTNKEGEYIEKNAAGNITNRTPVPYSDHATGVTSMIGGKGYDQRFILQGGGIIEGNTRGILPKATFENYSFQASVLEGESEEKDVLQKILQSKLNLSNHSYGIQGGWNLKIIRNNLGAIDRNRTGWYWTGFYNFQKGEAYSIDGHYNEKDQSLDDIVYENPSMIIVKAAGNSFGKGPNTGINQYSDGTPIKTFYFTGREFPNGTILPEDNCQRGYDCISMGSLAKNIILVGATEKLTTADGKYSKVSDVVKASYSSAGPRDDGAIKPDITSVGSSILHASSNASGSEEWDYGDGTSYSTPLVTGIIGAWIEINKKLFNDQSLHAASAKALLIHSAQEAGSIGPDIWYGWGFADAKKGAELLVEKSNNSITFKDTELENKGKNEFIVETNGKQPLKVTISWIDPSAKDIPQTFIDLHNNRTSRLVNDLDLRIINIKTKEVYEPWKLDINAPMAPAIKGDNLVDNVEQVLIDNPTAGRYIIQVSHKGDLVDNEGNNTKKQKYTIIATGYNRIIDNKETHTSKINIHPTLITGSENVLISFEENIDSISVYNMAGRLLKQEEVKSPLHQLNFSTYPKGVYLINVKSGNHSVSKKILKQ